MGGKKRGKKFVSLCTTVPYVDVNLQDLTLPFKYFVPILIPVHPSDFGPWRRTSRDIFSRHYVQMDGGSISLLLNKYWGFPGNEDGRAQG